MTEIQYLQTKLTALAEPSTVKLLTTGLVTLVSFFFGEVYNDAITGIIMLMIMDTVLGMAAARHEGQNITSRRFSRAVVKGIVYLSAISAGYFADLTIPGAFIQSTMVAFVGVTEFISILENMGRLGYKTPKKLLNQLHTKYQDHNE